MRDLVFEFKDIWKVRLSADGPEKVTPLKVHLKPDAVPHNAKARGYAPKHTDFMRKRIRLLEEIGYIPRNPRSPWGSAVSIAPKPKLPDKFRMTVSTKHPNSHLVVIAGCFHILEVILQHVELASPLSSLDAFKGF